METNSERLINELTLLNDETVQFTQDFVKIRRAFSSDSMFFSASGDYSFENLSPDAIEVQNRIYKRFTRTMEFINVLLSDSPERHSETFNQSKDNIQKLFLHNSLTWFKSTNEVVDAISSDYLKIKETIKTLYPNSTQEPFLIPDTNALYFNTDIESWEFDGFGKFTLVITPSILADLDRHKIEHRNEEVRKKAILIINKIKEYRRRGRLTEGVVLKRDKINLVTIAKEPDFTKTLSWLNSKNDDDRLIAECLEIMKDYSNRAVYLITADINLQNKCEITNLIFMEPPNKQ